MKMGSASAPLLESVVLGITARSSIHGDYAEEIVWVGQDHERYLCLRRELGTEPSWCRPDFSRDIKSIVDNLASCYYKGRLV